MTDAPGLSDLHRINRRLFLREAGRGSIAIAVLGSGVLAACNSNGDIVADTIVAAAAATAEPTVGSDPATAEPTVVQEDKAVTADEEELLRWERVLLGSVSAYVLARKSEVAIVDTGNPGSAEAIGSALTTLGATWGDVGHVILTHLHGDHVGGLPGVLELAPTAMAYAGAADVEGITSPRELNPLNDGDEVFGLEVIGTPGHTAGHISVLDRGASFLVAGDALNGGGGLVLGPNEQYTPDMVTARASVRRLAERQFETVVFGHGNPFEGGASDAVVALAQTL